MASGLDHGVSNLSLKGEDVSAVRNGDDGDQLFAVFDGHGGADAAKSCASNLSSVLLSLNGQGWPGSGHGRFPTKDIEDAFWDEDHNLGSRGVYAGTTAVVLMVADKPGSSSSSGSPADGGGGGGKSCTVAHVGDSVGLWFSMTSEEKTPPIIGHTRAHVPTDEDEVSRCNVEWAVRREVEEIREDSKHSGSFNNSEPSDPGKTGGGGGGGHAQDGSLNSPAAANGVGIEAAREEPESFRLLGLESFFVRRPSREEMKAKEDAAAAHAEAERRASFKASQMRHDSFYAVRRAPTKYEVTNALERLGRTLDEPQIELLTRALGREKRIEAPERRQSILNQLNGTPSPNRKLARQDSKVLSRVSMYDSSVHNGPTVLGAGVNAQVTTAMTRSIGDWDGSRAMIPHPDVNRFEVGHGEWVRVVLASDGIWDMIKHDEAARIARRHASPAVAADRLCELAHRRGQERLGQLKDDTTCVCVDLNPSELAFEKPTAGGGEGGCCITM